MELHSWKFVGLFAAAVVSGGLVSGCQTTTPLTCKLPDGVKAAQVKAS